MFRFYSWVRSHQMNPFDIIYWIRYVRWIRWDLTQKCEMSNMRQMRQMSSKRQMGQKGPMDHMGQISQVIRRFVWIHLIFDIGSDGSGQLKGSYYWKGLYVSEWSDWTSWLGGWVVFSSIQLKRQKDVSACFGLECSWSLYILVNNTFNTCFKCDSW